MLLGLRSLKSRILLSLLLVTKISDNEVPETSSLLLVTEDFHGGGHTL